MNTPIFRDPFVAYVDDDRRECIASTPGPAGVAELDLGNGAVITVDYVFPGQLVSVDLARSTRRSVVTALFGATRGNELLGLEARNDGRPQRIGNPDANPLQSLPRRRTGGSYGYEAGQVGGLALLNTMSRNERSSDLARGVAALEFGHTIVGGDVEFVPGLRRLLAPAIRRAGELLLASPADLADLVGRDPLTARRIAEQCRRVAPDNRSFATIARLIEDQMRRNTDDDEFGWRDFGTDAVHRSIRLSAPPRRQIYALQTVADFATEEPTLLPVPDYSVELHGGGRLVVEFHRKAAGAWIRVLHAETLVLLALAPVLDDNGDQTAEAIVPTDLAREQLLVEVTDRPLPEATSALARTRQAIRLARDAVEMTASGASSAARDLWHASEAIWRELGDESRANLAREFAYGKPRLVREVTLAERVAASERRAKR